MNGTLPASPYQVYSWFVDRPNDTEDTKEIQRIIAEKTASLEREEREHEALETPGILQLAQCARCILWVSTYEEPPLVCDWCDNYTIPDTKAGLVAKEAFRFRNSPFFLPAAPTLKDKWVGLPWPAASVCALAESGLRLLTLLLVIVASFAAAINRK